MSHPCYYTVSGERCTTDAEYVVLGEGITCFFTVKKPWDKEQSEFCFEHAEVVRLHRQTETPVR